MRNQVHHRRTCESCGGEYWAARSHSKTCGPVCKKRLQRGVDREGLGRRLGERRPRSAIAAVKKGTDKNVVNDGPRSIIKALMEAWPHGTLAYYKPQRGPRQAGRVNWLCRHGDELRKQYDHCHNTVGGASVPFETLEGITLRLVADLVKES